MRKLLCVVLAIAGCFISGCIVLDTSTPLDSEHQTGEQLHPQVELQGPHYAKLNSIGCIYYRDVEIIKTADFETIENMIREKRCFVIPTDTDVFIKERVNDDIVSAKLRGSTQLFYTVKGNLGAK